MMSVRKRIRADMLICLAFLVALIWILLSDLLAKFLDRQYYLNAAVKHPDRAGDRFDDLDLHICHK